MRNSKPQANIELFQQAKEFYLPKKEIDFAKIGTTSERLQYVLSQKIVTVNQMCSLCNVERNSVLYFLFEYNHNLTIYTYKNKHNCYFFTTSLELFESLMFHLNLRK